jgi:hypothetical protein
MCWVKKILYALIFQSYISLIITKVYIDKDKLHPENVFQSYISLIITNKSSLSYLPSFKEFQSYISLIITPFPYLEKRYEDLFQSYISLIITRKNRKNTRTN